MISTQSRSLAMKKNAANVKSFLAAIRKGFRANAAQMCQVLGFLPNGFVTNDDFFCSIDCK